MPTSSPSTPLAVALASPQRVASHDEQGWLDLFTEDARVEDPVGTPPHSGREALRRFWRSFIADNDISLSSRLDLVVGQGVARDVTIDTRLAGGTRVRVDSYIRYTCRPSTTGPRLDALDAFWQLRDQVA